MGTVVDIQPTNQQPMSDDQELAKVLAGVSAQADDTALPVEEPIVTTPIPEPTPAAEEPAEVVEEEPVVTPDPIASTFSTPSGDGSLESIKKDAIVELRPLVDKLDLAPEEKFDTYLLLLRSTDDKDLIAPAHEAAKNIPDEARRAQALLDIIKEIDFLSGQKPAI